MSCATETLNDQVHPTDTNIESDDDATVLLQTDGEKIPLFEESNSQSNITTSIAWEEVKNIATKSLGRNVGLRVSQFTNHSNGEESDSENEIMCRRKTRSLGRKEVMSVVTGYHANNIIPVSERSAVYKELITSSMRSSPKHSVMRLNDTSPVKSRIELNHFFQLDKQAKLHPDLPEKRRNTTPSRPNIIITPEIRTPTVSKNYVSGMSVQMRIKIWKEKEKSSAREKIEYRKSSTSLVAVELKDDCQVNNEERNVQSDDEMIKNSGSCQLPESGDSTRVPRQNIYEEINDTAKKYRIDEAFSSSSSSESSPVSSPMKTSRKNSKKVEASESLTASKKNDKDDDCVKKKSRSIWNIRSPLVKRKSKNKDSVSKKENDIIFEETEKMNKGTYRMSYNRKAVMKKKRSTESSRDEEISDDVFSPINEPGSGKIFSQQSTNSEEMNNNKLRTVIEQQSFKSEELPSLFDKVGTSISSGPGESPSISQDILNIIDSLGTIEEKHTFPENLNGSISSSVPIISRESVSEESNSDEDFDSGNEGDEDTQSSLDVKHIGRQTLKRRASDSFRTNTSIQGAITNGRKGSLSPFDQNAEGVVATSLMYADVIWDRVALDNDELNFKVGDVVEILDMTDDVWWHGNVGDDSGWFPAAFVRLRVVQDSESEDDSTSIDSKTSDSRDASSECPLPDVQRHSDPTPDSTNISSTEQSSVTLPRTFHQQQGNSVRRRMTIRRRDSSASTLPQKLSPNQVRAKIIQEIISTEQDYVRNLEDIIEGFLKQCQKYNKLFDDEQIEVIFSNVEQVYLFQRDFLRELEARIKPEHVEQSEIGEVFVINQHEFKVYSLYCNSHPHAVNEMNLLHANGQYTLFFESCRLLRNLQDISLEGFLLTPVQKICKYPLQLAELLKYTSEDHPDYPHVVAAQRAMKNVALLINEQKRRIENVGKIGCWQKTIEGWKGPDVLETSTEMIHNGELHKISKGHSQERHFFLFDHQLIYCKKDAIIGGKLTFKGRLNLDNCQIADLSDKSAMHGNTPVKNGWRMNNKIKDKWYIIYARNSKVKEQWMNAFKKERERVKEDEEKGFHIAMKMKKAAVALCVSTSSSTEVRRKRRSIHKRYVALNESMESMVKQRIDSSSGNKKLAGISMSVSTQPSKKIKSMKKKVNSIP